MANLAIRAEAQNINAIAKFGRNVSKLMEIMGKTEVVKLAPGTAYNVYKSSGTLSTQTVAEKGLIPDSGIAMAIATVNEITYSKYRNLTSIEKIGKHGYDIAVGGSNDAVLGQAQAKIKSSIISALADGTATVGAGTSATFQQILAKAAGKVEEIFEDIEHTPVFFVNTQDAFAYLGTHNVTVETAFGFSYLQNFLGMGNVVLTSAVPAGTVYGTACENLDLVAADVAAIEGMELTTDETGIIAIHNGARYENGALECVLYTGLTVQPIFLDRIVKATATA